MATNADTMPPQGQQGMDNIRQAGIEGHRKHSSPVSPRTIKEYVQHVDQPSPPVSESSLPHTPYASGQSSIDNTDLATPMPSSIWRPLGIFSVDQTKPIPDEMAACEPIILRQKGLFRQLGAICASAARKFWHIQRSGTSSFPPITHCSAISPYTYQPCQAPDKVPAGQRTEPSHTNQEESSLMEYVLRINDSILRCAAATAVNHNTDFADSLLEAMQLLTWAEQIGHVAKTGGYAMSDEDITEAIAAARCLLWWLSCAEGLDEFYQLWEGLFVDGGLVLSEEDSDTDDYDYDDDDDDMNSDWE